MAVIWLTMRGIQRHYQSVAAGADARAEDVPVTLPSSNVAIVLVSKLHLPTLRALAYARATRPARLEAITVDVDEAETARLKEEWERAGIPVPLTVVSSPVPGDHPAGDRVREAAAAGEPARHRHGLHPGVRARPLVGAGCCTTRARCGSRPGCCSLRGVVVASVPYQLQSATRGRGRRPPTRSPAAGGRAPARQDQAAAVAAADQRPGRAARGGRAGRGHRDRSRRASPGGAHRATARSARSWTWPARCGRSRCGRAGPA